MESFNLPPLDIAIIGAGITGLAAGYEAQQCGVQSHRSFSVEIFEASSHVGGKIATNIIEHETGRFLLEQGPDSFLVQKPWALELAKELGLEDELLELNSEQRHIFVFKQGRLQRMPEGMMLMVPTRFWPFVTTSVLSWCCKIRAAFEFLIQRKKDLADESVEQFVKRRFGQEIFDTIAEPLLAGIYNADASRQSLRATFPQLAAMEQKYKSLIRGMLLAPQKTVKNPFVSFQNGMQTLVSALEKKLTSSIKLNTRLDSIFRLNEEGYELTFQDGKKRRTRSLILTLPAIACANLVETISPAAAALLRQLRTISSGCIYFAFQKSDIHHPLKGFGFVVPGHEKRSINAVTWVSSKLKNRAPSETILLRVFFGGYKNPSIMKKSDLEIEEIALFELQQIMNIRVVPLFSRLMRDHENPQYDVGHLEFMQEINAALPKGIQIAGSAYGGVGIPDCIYQGRENAQKAIQHVLRKSPSSL